MEQRPLADRVEGIDALLRTGAEASGLDTEATTWLRIVVAEVLRRHGELCEHLLGGQSAHIAVGAGIIHWWPNDLSDYDLPMWGRELPPVVHAALEPLTVEQRAAVLRGAEALTPICAAESDRVEAAGCGSIAAGAAVEFLDGIMCELLFSGLFR
jgi:hypothetical protein